MKFVIPTAFSPTSQFCEMAVLAEQNGIDAIAISDHVAHPAHRVAATRTPRTDRSAGRRTPPGPIPSVAIGAMAAVTTRLRFVTNIYVLALRNPFLAAKADRHGRGALGRPRRARRGCRLVQGGVRARRPGLPHARPAHRRDDRGAAQALERRLRRARRPLLPVRSRAHAAGAGATRPDLRRRTLRARAAPRRAARRLDLGSSTASAELREIAATLRRYRAAIGRDGEPFAMVAACSTPSTPTRSVASATRASPTTPPRPGSSTAAAGTRSKTSATACAASPTR